jgi:hypothetical protein
MKDKVLLFSVTKKDFEARDRSTIWQQFVQKVLNELNKNFETIIYNQWSNLLLLLPSDN